MTKPTNILVHSWYISTNMYFVYISYAFSPAVVGLVHGGEPTVQRSRLEQLRGRRHCRKSWYTVSVLGLVSWLSCLCPCRVCADGRGGATTRWKSGANMPPTNIRNLLLHIIRRSMCGSWSLVSSTSRTEQ